MLAFHPNDRISEANRQERERREAEGIDRRLNPDNWIPGRELSGVEHRGDLHEGDARRDAGK